MMTGTRLAHYEILSHVGSGGMGDVYAARDLKLGRTVALKFLPPAFTDDRPSIERLEREARLLAAVNHPNIASLYGVEETASHPVLVMEFVEGETLAQRLARGPVPIDDAIRIGRQIAEGLDAAHQRGIVHRDLKPANVKIAPNRTAKILDFGIASGARLLAGPTGETLTLPPAEIGGVIGTPAYMSPEQTRGESVDKRTDIWAFGCVLFEMLTGRRVFAAATLSDTVAAVLQRDPDWSLLPSSTPPYLQRVLRRCLMRDLTERARDIGDVRNELVDDLDDQPPAARKERFSRKRRELVAWASAAALGIALFATILTDRQASSLDVADVTWSNIDLPPDQRLAISARAHPLAISPDGRRIAYIGAVDGRAQLYVRDLSALEPRTIVNTEGARQPFFSPDGDAIGFFADGALKRVNVEGGAPLQICNVPTTSLGGSWGSNGTIVFAAEGARLMRVSATGGRPEPIPGVEHAAWPQILPDGRTVLYTRIPRDGFSVIPLDGGEPRVVARTTDSTGEGPPILGTGEVHPARYVRSGYLLYGQDPGYVRVVPFDLQRTVISGSPVALIEGVERGQGGGAVFFAASDTGNIIYASTGFRHQLVWVDRTGGETLLTPDRDAFRGPTLSPDGQRLAVSINDATRRSDIWIYDVSRGTRSRVTSEGHNLSPVWHPRGTLIFSGGTGQGPEFREYGVEGPGQLLHDRFAYAAYPTSWSPDGTLLLFQSQRASGVDLWVLDRDTRQARALLERPFTDQMAKFSPRGRYIAYVSDESGGQEVFVAEFPALNPKIMVSTDGGSEPRWAPNGRELFYRQGDALMAVPIELNGQIVVGTPRRLFSGPYSGVGQSGAFDVASDGERFVMVKSDDAGTLRRLTLVQHWDQDIGRIGRTLP